MDIKILKKDYNESQFQKIVLMIQRETLTDDDVEMATSLYGTILATLFKLKKHEYPNINLVCDSILNELNDKESLKQFVVSIFSLLEALNIDFNAMYIKTNFKKQISIRVD